MLRQICRAALEGWTVVREGRTFNIAIHLVGADEITNLNENFLHHSGPADVITFDYIADSSPGCLAGEIFICVDEAIAQARRFRVSWQAEVVRYAIHGLLHLQGYDDQAPGLRKKMKRRENRLLKELSRRFDWGRLEADKHAVPTK